MPQSPRYRELDRRLTQLKKHLIPKASATGTYTERQRDRVRAYRLLAHAEIEAYFEDRARQVIKESLARWRQDRKPDRVVLSLVAYYRTPEHLSTKKVREIYKQRRAHIEDALNQANSAYFRMLANNHGIREENILQILFPLGIETVEIDSTWLAIVDSFGHARGETAHTSIKTQQPPDPVSECDTVKQIRDGIRHIDGLIERMRR